MVRPGLICLRAAAVIVGAVAAAIALGRDVGQGAASSADALFAVGFASTLLTFAAAPRLRRDDLALAAAFMFVACGALRQAFGGAEPGLPVLFGSAGVLAAWAPGKVERLRSNMRQGGARIRRRVSDWRSLPKKRAEDRDTGLVA